VPVLDLLQHRLNILDHRALAYVGIHNRNQLRRDLVGKVSMSSRRFREIGIESDFVLVHLTSRLSVGQLLLCLWHMCNDPELLEHPQSVPYIPAFYDLLARQSMNPDSGNLHLFTSRRDAH